MLDRAVREMKGEVRRRSAEIQLNLGLNIRIPAEYITEENQRLRMYKRVAGVETEAQLKDVRAELRRPLWRAASRRAQPVGLCFAETAGNARWERLRLSASANWSTSSSAQNAAIDPGKLARFVASQRGAQFTPDGTLKFSIKIDSAEGIFQTLRDLWKNWKFRSSHKPHELKILRWNTPVLPDQCYLYERSDRT